MSSPNHDALDTHEPALTPLAVTVSRPDRIFPTLTPEQVSRIAAHGRRRSTRRGEVLVEVGDQARKSGGGRQPSRTSTRRRRSSNRDTNNTTGGANRSSERDRDREQIEDVDLEE